MNQPHGSRGLALPPETAKAPQLRAVFLLDRKTGSLRGARCDLPGGETVEVTGRHTPLYDLARELDARGHGGFLLRIYTPAGTPSLGGLVRELAGLAITERSRTGLALTKYSPFDPHIRPVQRHEPVLGAQVGEHHRPWVARGQRHPQRTL